MKNYILCALFIFFLIAFLPFIGLIFTDRDKGEETLLSYTVGENESAQEITEDKVRVLQVSTGKVLNLDMTEYLIGAVAGEMPASFSDEALKAQAVACYTYVKWIMHNSDNAPNEFSDISDDSSIHQGYMSKEQLEERWGNKYNKYYSKIEKAVNSVKNEYISYNGEPILAVFHGLSAGQTNSSEDVWANSYPYLVSVDAPGDKLSADLISLNSFTYGEFTALAKEKIGISDDSVSQSDPITVISSTDSGYVKEAKIGDKTLSGTDIRSAFSLKSPNFEIEATDSEIIFTVYGKGHGLGMSQYSADFMARQGSDYKEILLHFYPGTQILKE